MIVATVVHQTIQHFVFLPDAHKIITIRDIGVLYKLFVFQDYAIARQYYFLCTIELLQAVSDEGFDHEPSFIFCDCEKMIFEVLSLNIYVESSIWYHF